MNIKERLNTLEMLLEMNKGYSENLRKEFMDIKDVDLLTNKLELFLNNRIIKEELEEEKDMCEILYLINEIKNKNN